MFVINRNSREQVKGVNLINCDRLNLKNILKNENFDLVLDITAYTKEHIETLLNAVGSYKDYIFISSSAVYPQDNEQPFNEKQKIGKNSVWGDYGINKVEAENYLTKINPNAYILRPPYFYGIYENLYREPFVFDCALQDRPFYIPKNGEMKLQFFNVLDLCRFIDVIIEKHPKNHIFNVGNKEIVTIKEWVSLCYKVAGKEAEFVSVDKKYNQRDYFCFYDYEYYLDVTEQYKIMKNTIPIEEGLKSEFEWYLKNRDCIYYKRPYMEFIDNNLK